MDKQFTKNLLQWFGTGKRALPWKKSNDPYRIWISEIILQQTQVAQGLPYYERIIARFPDIKDLAAASEEEVLALWKGLGYYSRARNLHKTAQNIVADHDSIFPQDHDDILALKGIGPYTAAAIASFAYNQAYAVVDGNVLRVLSRYYGIQESIDITAVKKDLSKKANMLIDKNRPGDFNQAIMDLGAMVCRPRQAQCSVCPLTKNCLAFNNDLTQSLPVRSPKANKKTRHFHYLVVNSKHGVLMQRRSQKDIWEGLYQLPLIEKSNDNKITQAEINRHFPDIDFGTNDQPVDQSELYKQTLSHQYIRALFYEFPGEKTKITDKNFQWIKKSELKHIAVPRIIDRYLTDQFEI